MSRSTTCFLQPLILVFSIGTVLSGQASASGIGFRAIISGKASKGDVSKAGKTPQQLSAKSLQYGRRRRSQDRPVLESKGFGTRVMRKGIGKILIFKNMLAGHARPSNIHN
ncbi:hypothetical protein HDK90DRAFT_255031 [Phyllosticta capitalensis]|uniref:Uncharacterized protein n=1 Tax=Phyllosticta capitalensis TaxID=121624 RepID=A0ABR1YR07_9PEZI